MRKADKPCFTSVNQHFGKTHLYFECCLELYIYGHLPVSAYKLRKQEGKITDFPALVTKGLFISLSKYPGFCLSPALLG